MMMILLLILILDYPIFLSYEGITLRLEEGVGHIALPVPQAAFVVRVLKVLLILEIRFIQKRIFVRFHSKIIKYMIGWMG